MPSPIPVATPAFGYRLSYVNFDRVAFAAIRIRLEHLNREVFGGALTGG